MFRQGENRGLTGIEMGMRILCPGRKRRAYQHPNQPSCTCNTNSGWHCLHATARAFLDVLTSRKLALAPLGILLCFVEYAGASLDLQQISEQRSKR